MKNTKKPTRGRPSNVKRIIMTNAVQLANKTNHEMVTFLLEKTPIRESMKGTDENILRRNLYVSVRMARNEAIKAGKKVSFKGRKVNGEVKTKWLHRPKAVVTQ